MAGKSKRPESFWTDVIKTVIDGRKEASRKVIRKDARVKLTLALGRNCSSQELDKIEGMMVDMKVLTEKKPSVEIGSWNNSSEIIYDVHPEVLTTQENSTTEIEVTPTKPGELVIKMRILTLTRNEVASLMGIQLDPKLSELEKDSAAGVIFRNDDSGIVVYQFTLKKEDTPKFFNLINTLNLESDKFDKKTDPKILDLVNRFSVL